MSAEVMTRDVKIARWVATIAGLIGFVLSVLTPLLPVVQTTATLNWPQNGQLNNVTSPLISLAPVSMTVTVPCDVVRSMPPRGGMVLGTAPKDGKQAALNALFVNVTSQRVDITDRNVVVASVPRARVVGTGGAPGCSRIEITSSEAGTFATFVGLTDTDDGQGAAHRLSRPEPAPGDRRRLHGPDRARAAGAERFCRDRHPVLHQANAFEAGRDGAGDRRDHRRAGRAVAAGPARRPADAAAGSRSAGAPSPPPTSSWSARFLVWHVIGANSSRRRLHPADGPRRRARRLHVELLPLVRQSRGPVRLVLQPAGADDQRQRRQHLDAAARPGVWDRVLALAVSRGAAPARARRWPRASPRCGRPAWCCWRRGCRSTTACAPRARSPPAR